MISHTPDMSRSLKPVKARVPMRSVVWLVAILLGGGLALAEDWPRWRGPRGDGTWNTPPLPDRWPASGLRTVWQQPVGGGYAGVTASRGRVYTMDRQPPPKSTASGISSGSSSDSALPDGLERVLCFDAPTGKLLWSHHYPVRYGHLGGYANGPRCSPSIAPDGKVYTLGAVGHLYCFDGQSGKVLWSHNTVERFGAVVPEWGFAGSPLVDGDQLIVHLGAKNNGCIISFDRHSGRERWRSLDDPAGYCTPAIFHAPFGRILVMWTPKHICGLDPDSGRVFWKVPYEVTYGVSIASPIYQENIIFVTGYWEGARAIRLGRRPEDHEVIWTDNRYLRGLMAQPLYRDGYVYMIDKNYGLTCFELASGKKIWDDDNQLTPRGRNPHASIVWLNNDGRALALNAVGELVLLRLHPKGYEELSRTKVLPGRVWGHPAFSGRYMYAKTDGAEAWRNAGQCQLVCIELPIQQ